MYLLLDIRIVIILASPYSKVEGILKMCATPTQTQWILGQVFFKQKNKDGTVSTLS